MNSNVGHQAETAKPLDVDIVAVNAPAADLTPPMPVSIKCQSRAFANKRPMFSA